MDLEKIRELSEEVYRYVRDTDMKSVPLGRHFFHNHIYANVEEYATKRRQDARFESHRKYIDIQYIISGSEKIIVDDVKELEVMEQYAPDRDIAFYYDRGKGKEYELKEGDFLILYPEEGHMPCISIKEKDPKHVKKMVFKIPNIHTKKIKALVMDVDGTLTDGKIYMGNDGEAMKAFDIKDGFGIANYLPKKGIVPIIITARESRIVENRARELKITYLYQGVKDKTRKLLEVMNDLDIPLSEAVYVGDDDNDLECFELVKKSGGLAACPLNASKRALTEADFISVYRGGNGAVRELIEWICNGE